MSVWMLLFMALSLSMDALAVSVANGIRYRDNAMKAAVCCAVFFGLFQAVMPLVGFYAGYTFIGIARGVGRRLALILLSAVGGRMILGVLRPKKDESGQIQTGQAFSPQQLFAQALATSIDALVVGVGLAAANINILPTVAFIGAVTFVCCFAGVWIGRFFGAKFSGKAELAGGVVLILIGLNIFLNSGA